MSTITLYHYTSYGGAQGIQQSQRIAASMAGPQGGDARFGNGVYFTSIPPEQASKLEIHLNNWDGTPMSWLKNLLTDGTDRTEMVIEVEVPRGMVKSVSVHGRDIYLVPGHIDLRQVRYRVRNGPAI